MERDGVTLRMEHDPSVDAAYICLSDDDLMPATRQVVAFVAEGRFEVLLDLSTSDKLIGIEILGASEAFTTETLADAMSIQGP